MHILHILHFSNIYHIKHILNIQEYDKWTCEPHPSCYRCYAGVPEFLRTDLPSTPKFMNKRLEKIKHEASGDGLRERGSRGVVEGSVVEWDENGANVRAGPNNFFLLIMQKGMWNPHDVQHFLGSPELLCPTDAAARRNACYGPWGHNSPDIGNALEILCVC